MKAGKDLAIARWQLVATAAVLCVLAVTLLPTVARAQQPSATKRVLVLYWYNKDYPWNVGFDQSFQATLQSSATGTVEYYPEYLESNRFPGEKHALLLRDYLRQKYADRTIDVVVANSDASLDFLRKYRSDLFPHAPIVFVATRRPTTEEREAGAGLTGIININTHRPTLDLALRFHPRTDQVFVVSGTVEHDKRFEKRAREELQGYEDRVKITYLTDLSPAELIARMKSLPEQSVVLYAWQQSLNQQGKVLESVEILASIAQSARVPIYGMSTSTVNGIIGGYFSTGLANGSKVAGIALRIANGERARDIPIENAVAEPMFDWRELQRWGISADLLPAGSIVRFKEVTFWEQHKWRVVGVLVLLVLQTVLIAVLLVERRKRQRAKELLDQLNAELEERVVRRTAALDAKSRELEIFAYSVAHDLKAPLRGMDGYSRLLLAGYADKLDDEGRSFLQSILATSVKMDQLIEDLLDYSRLDRREMKPDRVDLGPLIESLVEQKKHEAGEGNIDFVLNLNGGTVVADARGLTQALLNYFDNAIKFTRGTPKPRIEVGSQETDSACRVWVRDNGVGFDMKYRERIFEIFQRLHRSEEYMGTGVGLAIVRKAMERMGGRAWAESEPGRGATFYLEIPKQNELPRVQS